MRPADVCGWARYPNSPSSDSSLRMVAELRLRKWRLTSCCEPTGTAVTVNSRTTAFRISCFLGSNGVGTLRAGVLTVYRSPALWGRLLSSCSEDGQRDLVVQIEASSGRCPAQPPTFHQARSSELAEPILEGWGNLQAGGGAEPQHHPLGVGAFRRQLLSVLTGRSRHAWPRKRLIGPV